MTAPDEAEDGPTRIQLIILAQHEPAKVLEALRIHEPAWLERLIEAVRALDGGE